MKSSYIFDKIHAVFIHNIRMPTRHVGSTHQKMRPFWEGSRMLDPNFNNGTWRQKGCRQTASIPEFLNGFDQKSFPWILNDGSTDWLNERNIHVSSNVDVGLWTRLEFKMELRLNFISPEEIDFTSRNRENIAIFVVFLHRDFAVLYTIFWKVCFLLCWDSNFFYVFSWEPWPRDILFLAKIGRRCMKLLHSWNLTNGYPNWPCLKEVTFTKQLWGFNLTNLNSKVQDLSQNSQNFHERWRTTTNQPTWKLLPQKLGKAKEGDFLKAFTNGERREQGSEDNGSWGISKAFRRLIDHHFWPFKMDGHFEPKTSVPEHVWPEKHHGILKITEPGRKHCGAEKDFPFSHRFWESNMSQQKIGKHQKWIPILLSKWVFFIHAPFSRCIFGPHPPTICQPTRTPVKGSFFPTGPIDITIEATSTKKPRFFGVFGFVSPPRWVCFWRWDFGAYHESTEIESGGFLLWTPWFWDVSGLLKSVFFFRLMQFLVRFVFFWVKIPERKDVACFKKNTLGGNIQVPWIWFMFWTIFLQNTSSSDTLSSMVQSKTGLLMSCVVFEMVIFQIHDCWRKSKSSTTLIGVILVESSSDRSHSVHSLFWKSSKNGFQLFKLCEITSLNWNVLWKSNIFWFAIA